MKGKKGAVLCVDDEPNILRSLHWLLHRDFEVMTAPGGHAALSMVRLNDFDVVISDQRMPGMTGVEFLREVRQIAPRAMRILLTGYSDMAAVTSSVNESEVFRFINKPWHIKELPRIVEEAADIAKAHPAPVPTPGATEHAAIGEFPATLLLIDDDPVLAEMLRKVVGTGMDILQARTLSEAVDMLSTGDVGVVVSDTEVGHADTSRLLKLMKERFPGIVTVVFASAVDANHIIALINQGQIYRFIPKPIREDFLRMVVTAALRKHQQLRENPEHARRHQVERMDAAERDTLMQDICPVSLATDGVPGALARHPAYLESLRHRVSTGFRRLFGI